MLAQISLSLLAAALPLARAQTSTLCNPLTANCPSDSAMGASLKTNFAGASSLPGGWAATAGSVSFDSTGAKFVVGKQGDAPTIQTSDYFFFGYAEVKMQAAAGQGIVSSIVLESDDLDEVDWEFTGTDTTQTQSNYFGKGDTTTYDRAIWYPVSTPQTTFHTYAVNWTSAQITWLIDGVAVRTLNYNDAKGGTRFPQTPMRLRLGVWAGGDPANGQGTIEWAGGPTDYSKAPFTMYVSSVNIVNYSPAGSYSFGDNSGSWGSIKVSGAAAPEQNSNTGSSKNGVPAGAAASNSSPASSVTSGSAAIKVSTASAPISSSTGGGVTSSAVLTQLPLLGGSSASPAAATGLATSARANGTAPAAATSANGTAPTPSKSPAVASSNDAPARFGVRFTLSAAALVAAGFVFCL